MCGRRLFSSTFNSHSSELSLSPELCVTSVGLDSGTCYAYFWLASSGRICLLFSGILCTSSRYTDKLTIGGLLEILMDNKYINLILSIDRQHHSHS